MKFRIGTITVLDAIITCLVMVVVLIAVKTYYRPHLGRIWEHVPAAVRAAAAGAIAPVPRISTKSGPFSPGEWLESLPGSARGY